MMGIVIGALAVLVLGQMAAIAYLLYKVHRHHKALEYASKGFIQIGTCLQNLALEIKGVKDAEVEYIRRDEVN